MGHTFDLSKPETLLMPDDIDDALCNHINEELFKKILTWGKALNVSDIVFQIGVPIKIKKNNLVYCITKCDLSVTAVVRFIGIIYGARDGDDSAYQRIMAGAEDNDNNTTYAYKVGNAGQAKKTIRYRVNCLRDGDTDASIVMRLNNDQILSLEQIGQTRDGEIYKHMFPMKGLNLITGSVDSGKTTLIYACLNEFILNDPKHAFIDTYEMPIEGDLREVARKNGIQNKSVRQCPVPLGVRNFSDGISQSLRRNADIILIGEIRTQEEVIGVINGVLATGKLVMGTLHTDNIPVTFSRLYNTLSSSNEGQMRSLIYDLVSSTNMIVSQKLLQTVDKKRVAVFESLVFTKAVKERLNAVPMENLTAEITAIMKESDNTMVDKAKRLFEAGRLSKEVYIEFKNSFSY